MPATASAGRGASRVVERHGATLSRRARVGAGGVARPVRAAAARPRAGRRGCHGRQTEYSVGSTPGSGSARIAYQTTRPEIHDRDLQDQHHEDQLPGFTRHSRSVGNQQVAPASAARVNRGCSSRGRARSGGSTPRESSSRPGRARAQAWRQRDLDERTGRAGDANTHGSGRCGKLAGEREAAAAGVAPATGPISPSGNGVGVGVAASPFERRAVTSSGDRPLGRSRTRARRSGGGRQAPRSSSARRAAGGPVKVSTGVAGRAPPAVERVRDGLDRVGHRPPALAGAPDRVEQRAADAATLGVRVDEERGEEPVVAACPGRADSRRPVPSVSATNDVPVRSMCRCRFENVSSGGAGGSKPCGTKTLPIASRKIAWSRRQVAVGRGAKLHDRDDTSVQRGANHEVEGEAEQEPDHDRHDEPLPPHLPGRHREGEGVAVRDEWNRRDDPRHVPLERGRGEADPASGLPGGTVWHETSPLVSQPWAAIETLVMMP